jgi:hypothetical protein
MLQNTKTIAEAKKIACNKSISVVTHKSIVKYGWGVYFMRNDCAALRQAGFNNFTNAKEQSLS